MDSKSMTLTILSISQSQWQWVRLTLSLLADPKVYGGFIVEQSQKYTKW